jgi:Lrp/AsnC family leucine-responsive transcriptional regulator
MKEKPESFKMRTSDLKILSALRSNGRETLKKISADTGISISLVFDRLKSMEEEGLIRSYSCSVDLKRLGLNSRVLLLIRMPERLRDKAQARLASRHHINNLWRLDGKCGLAAEAMFVSLRQQEVFIKAFRKEFEDVEISTHEVVENPKWEGFLTSCLTCKKLNLFGPTSRTESKKMLCHNCLN